MKMEKSITLIAATLLFVSLAGAQSAPRFETFFGYNYVRTDLERDKVLGQSLGSFSMHGGDAQFIYNFNKVFSGVVDLGAVHKGNIGVLNIEDRRAFFLLGPRVSYRRSSRWTPYFEVLFGASERSASKQVTAVTDPNTPLFPVATPHNLFPGPGVEITARLSASQTDFALVTGGGLDLKISKRFALRPIEADYVLTTFPSLLTGNSGSQHGLRLLTGLFFTFGER
jgi:hypothetical protein